MTPAQPRLPRRCRAVTNVLLGPAFAVLLAALLAALFPAYAAASTRTTRVRPAEHPTRALVSRKATDSGKKPLHARSESAHPVQQGTAKHARTEHTGAKRAEAKRAESRPAGSRRAERPSARAADTPAATKAHGKSGGRKYREPEIVDDPVIMHRTGARGTNRRDRDVPVQKDVASIRTRAVPSRSRYGKETARLRESQDSRRIDLPSPSGKTIHGVTSTPAPAVASVTRNDVKDLAVSRGLSVSETAERLAAMHAAAQASRRNLSEPDDEGVVRSNTVRSTGASPASSGASGNWQDKSEIRSTLPVAVVAANTLAVPKSPLAPSRQVVTGFGAEVATLTPAPGDRSTPTAQLDREAAAEDLTGTADATRALAEDATQPMVLPRYERDGRLVMPAPLKGSRAVLVHQNVMADQDGLERIRNDGELNRLRQQHMLVSFPENASLRVNDGLPENRRYARPWTVKFAADAARAFYAQFGEPLQVNSAVRTVSYQLRLQRVNGNAAAVDGDGASPHLTGQAIDLAKRGMSMAEIAWMRSYLLPLMEAGKLDVEEEFRQACFHISVYRAYTPVPRRRPAARLQVAQAREEPRGGAVTHAIADNEGDR